MVDVAERESGYPRSAAALTRPGSQASHGCEGSSSVVVSGVLRRAWACRRDSRFIWVAYLSDFRSCIERESRGPAGRIRLWVAVMPLL
jgi:hypothetical protein